jgi:MFS superfamily sulfate permease-like transporter
MSLGLFVGLFQILFAVLHFGFITRYLSDVILSGFAIGAGII